jgi:hypothetical protein
VSGVQHAGDAGMVQGSENLSFPQETFVKRGETGAGTDHFDGDQLLNLAVNAFDQRHRPHAALAQRTDHSPRTQESAFPQGAAGLEKILGGPRNADCERPRPPIELDQRFHFLPYAPVNLFAGVVLPADRARKIGEFVKQCDCLFTNWHAEQKHYVGWAGIGAREVSAIRIGSSAAGHEAAGFSAGGQRQIIVD